MKRVHCQGKTFTTTDDVAHAIMNFFQAAQRRGRVVKIDVPAIADTGEHVVELVLFPGEQLDVFDSPDEHVELDTAPLIRSLSARKLAWRPHTMHGGETA
ncbi:hypothetical protein [Agreia bicolorata]|uniref:Uncharacterized protein n=1 Tax=Agreia bicolorata TaxID=110935 RepID=A0ABR5CDJ3_9MICO|nr:hypothetical protein [Agreia bicolorata]KJC63688.1 hypothetical protein TZ00_14425 [Agreia bicolorata]